MFCYSQLLCTRGSLHSPWTQTHCACPMVGLKNPSNAQSSFFSVLALSFQSLLLSCGQCKGGGSCLPVLQKGQEFSKHHQRNFGRSVLSCISGTLVLEPWNSLQSARSVELREHLPEFSKGPSGGTAAQLPYGYLSAHEITLHCSYNLCRLHFGASPPRAEPVNQPHAKLCSRPERCLRCIMLSLYFTHGCLCKMSLSQERFADLCYINGATLQTTVCCATVQNLGVGKNRSALRSSVLSCHLEEYPENHRHKKKTLRIILFMH